MVPLGTGELSEFSAPWSETTGMRLPNLSLGSAPGVKFGFALMGLTALAGCGEKGIARYPVHGAVHIDNAPADGVMVVFCPVGGSEQVQKTRPFGFTDAEGKFELTTIKKGDGAPAGDYKVLAQWPAKSSSSMGDSRSTGGDRLQGRYMNLEKSQIKVTVKEGTNDVPPFELKSR
jgi:hypothetical protein